MFKENASLFAAWLGDFIRRLGQLALDVLLLVAVIALALVAGLVLKWLIRRILTAIGFDKLAGKIGLTASFRRAGLKSPPSRYVARFGAWMTVFVFIVAGAASLRIPGTTAMLDRAFAFVPAFVAALVILIAGVLIAEFFARAVLIAAVNAGWHAARTLSAAARALIILLTAAMTLEQLGVAPTVVVASVSILFGGIVLALAIAFGLGGRELARDYLKRHFTPPPEERAGEEMEHL